MRLFPKVAKLYLLAKEGDKVEQADFSKLDFDFEVSAKLPLDKKEKNKTEPITAQVILHGLNEETRDKISANETAIRIEYGYGDEVFEIFEGLNTNVFHVPESIGWRTEIYAKHNWEAYKTSYFSKSYEDEIPVKKVLDDVLKSFGLPISNLYGRSDKIIGGVCFDGESRTILDSLCRDWSLNWRIENSTIKLEDSLNPPLVDRTRVVILGPSILNGPTVDESLEDEGKPKEKIVRRVSATSILLPQLWPGVPVKFDVKAFGRTSSSVFTKKISNFDENAIFICDSVIHKGSSRAVECLTDITTKEEKV